MKLDERAERAATDLLERAALRPIPTIDDLVHPTSDRRLPSRRILAIAAAVAIVVGGLAFVTTRERPLPRVDHPAGIPVPAGIRPQLLEPEGSGISVEVPSSWTPSTTTFGADYGWTDQADVFVSVSRLTTVDDADAKAFTHMRAELFQRSKAKVDVGPAAATVIDGYDAVVRHVGVTDANTYDTTEYDIDLEDGTWAVVIVGERVPVDHDELREWIASTITVSSTPLWNDDIAHPSQLPPPDGVSAMRWAPARLGVSLDVPSTWKEPEPTPSGFDEGISSTSGPVTFVLASRVSHALADADSRQQVLERQFHVRLVDRTDTVIDGHHARIARYRYPFPDLHGLAALDTEYDIDLGNGESVWLVIGTHGGTTPELLDWIRSTIRVTG